LRQRESIYHWSYASAVFNWGLEMTGLLGPRVANARGMVNGRFVVVKNVEVGFSFVPLVLPHCPGCLTLLE
jgi:hypothetical protein